MSTWWVCARTNHGVPSSASADAAQFLGDTTNGVEVATYSESSDGFTIELELEADREDEAVQRAYAWLEDFCRNGQWIDQEGLTVNFESDEPSADFTEVQDVFSIAGVERRDT